MQDRNTLNYRPQDKGIPKTIEYIIEYECDPDFISEVIEEFEDIYNTTITNSTGG